MKEICALDSNSILRLYMSQKSYSKKLRAEIERLEDHFISQQIREVVEDNYDLGKVVEIYEIFGGYTSRAFWIVLEKYGERQNWFFRKYMKPKPETEVLFEHDLLLYARENGFMDSAVPIPTEAGKTYVSKTQGDGEYMRLHHFTVYEFLTGEVKYDWDNNEMPRESYVGMAEIVAGFHHSVWDFDPKDRKNVTEPPIIEFIKMMPEKLRFYWEEYGSSGVKNCFTDYLHSQLGFLEEVSNSLTIKYEDLRELPVIPIQCDVHPGNFKFTGDICTGIFDFEAAKMDIRLFELALGVFNTFSSWLTDTDGIIYLDRTEDFLRAYNEKLLAMESGLPTITKTEKKYFCDVLQMSNIYMIQWATRVYHTDMTKNHYEYFYYLQHLMRSVRWVEDNREEIAAMLERL